MAIAIARSPRLLLGHLPIAARGPLSCSPLSSTDFWKRQERERKRELGCRGPVTAGTMTREGEASKASLLALS